MRFYGLLVPPLPPSGSISSSDEGGLFKRMYALQYFMETLCANPFLRNDDLYTSFVSDPNPFDRTAAVRKPRYSVAVPRAPGEPPKASIGVRRWRQAVLSSPRVDNLELVVKSASKEADVLIRGLKNMKNAARTYIGHINNMAEQSTALAGKFGAWMDAEERVVCTLRGDFETSDKLGFIPHNAAGTSGESSSPTGNRSSSLVAKHLRWFKRAHEKYTDWLTSTHVPGMTQVLMETFRYEIACLEALKSAIHAVKVCASKASRARSSVSSIKTDIVKVES